jgi:biotin operon repressor
MSSRDKQYPERTLALLKAKGTVTPSEINTELGCGDYASKNIWYLRKLGFEISVNKQGRSVASYSFVADGKGAGAMAARAAKFVKAPKAPKIKAVKAPKPMKVGKASKPVMDVSAEKLLQDLNMSKEGEFGGGSYSVDPDFDSVEGVDLQALALTNE